MKKVPGSRNNFTYGGFFADTAILMADYFSVT